MAVTVASLAAQKSSVQTNRHCELDVDILESMVVGGSLGLTSMDSLASTYWNQRRWAEAEELEIQVMETSRKVFGEEHPSTLTKMANLDLRGSAPFTNIRAFAMQAFETYESTDHTGRAKPAELSLISQLQKSRKKPEVAPLQNIDVASECANHLLAVIEATGNLLLFLFWALFLPENERRQDELKNELLNLKIQASTKRDAQHSKQLMNCRV